MFTGKSPAVPQFVPQLEVTPGGPAVPESLKAPAPTRLRAEAGGPRPPSAPGAGETRALPPRGVRAPSEAPRRPVVFCATEFPKDPGSLFWTLAVQGIRSGDGLRPPRGRRRKRRGRRPHARLPRGPAPAPSGAKLPRTWACGLPCPRGPGRRGE